MPNRTLTEPIRFVTRYSVSRCRECGEPIEIGKHIWWIRGKGAAHLTCGWTLDSGKVHPGTRSSIRDIAPTAVATKLENNNEQRS